MLNALKSYSYLRYTLCILICFLGINKSFAQIDKLEEANNLANEKKYAQAIYILEQVISHPETKEDPQVWCLRAVSYFNYYKQIGKSSEEKSYLLDTAFSSANRTLKLNPDQYLKDKANKAVELIGNKYYALIKDLLDDSKNTLNPEIYYQKYKTITKFLNPTFDFKAKDLEYYSSVGSKFANLFLTDNFNSNYSTIAKNAYYLVLEFDPKNISANYNLGIIYYNQGVNLWQQTDYGTDFDQLEVLQDNAKKLFKQSEPYMVKVHLLEPKDIRALQGLEGIYYALHDEEKYIEFKLKKEALEQKNQK